MKKKGKKKDKKRQKETDKKIKNAGELGRTRKNTGEQKN